MATGRAKRKLDGLTFNEFFGPWAGDIRRQLAAEKASKGLAAAVQGDWDNANPRLIHLWADSPEMWDVAADWWPIRQLRQVAAAGDREHYDRIVFYLLSQLRAGFPRAQKGAPKREQTMMYQGAWERRGKPTLSTRVLDDIADEVDPGERNAIRLKKGVARTQAERVRRERVRQAIKRKP